MSDTDAAALRRIVELLLRVQVHALKGERNQKEIVLLLSGLGFTTTEIAATLGAPMASVKAIVSRAKRRM